MKQDSFLLIQIFYPLKNLLLLVLIILTSIKPLFSNQVDSLRSIIFYEKHSPKAQINAIYDIFEYYIYRDADTCFMLADKLIQLNTSKQDTITAAVLNMQGIAYYFKSEYKKSLEYLDSALTMEIQLKRKDRIAKIYANMANCYNNLSEYDKSLSYSIKSLDIWKGLNQKVNVAMSLYEIGNTYRHLNENEKAIKYFKESLQLVTEENDLRGIAACNSNLGNCYQLLNQFDKAQEHFEINLKIVTELKLPLQIATSYNNLGILFMAKKDYKTSYNYHKKAEKIRIEKNNKNGLLHSYMNLSRVLYLLERYQESEKYALAAYQMSKEISNKRLSMNLSRILFENYEKQNKYKEAFEYFKLFTSMQDSVMDIEKVNKINELEAKFQNEKKALEIDNLKHKEQIQQEEINKQNMQKTALAIGFGLTGVLAFVILNGYRRKKRDNELITQQKQEVENQKSAVEIAHHELKEKNKEILDSINYAKRIQNAILPPQKVVKSYLQESFILYIPKDIVAGDFYWLEQKNNKVLFAACDCTGHGVPGAMVSVICVNGLNRSVREHGLTDPGQILDKTREIVIQEFEKSEDEVKDGMDVSLCSLNLENNQLKWAGANNPLWIIRKNSDGSSELIEYKADKQPIGKYDEPLPYTTHTIFLQKNDTIYIFSDGYVDQFGGEKGKKFKAANLKNLLLSIQNDTLEKQKELINQAFESWKGSLEQVDDVCVIGVRV